MPSAGELLRQERLRRNRTLPDLSHQTRISVRYLEAVESDNVEALPGRFFYRSFIRQCIDALDIDRAQSERILEAAGPGSEPDMVALSAALEAAAQAEERPRGSSLSTSLVITLLVLVLAGCSGLYALWQQNQAKEEDAKLASVQGSERTTAAVPAEPQAVPEQAVPESDTRQEPAAPAAAAPATASDSPAGTHTVDLAATEQTWVRLSSEGKTVWAGTLDPAAPRNFSVAGSAKILTGNAGGLDVRWNGRPVGPIGPRGQIRVVLFDKESVQITTPAREVM